MAADIPVVFFNRQPVEEDLDRWDKLYYVGADAKESAVLEAEIVADQYERIRSPWTKTGMALSAMYSWREKTIIRIP